MTDRQEDARRLRAGEFDTRVLGAPVPVILVFSAQWCAPCKWLTPYLNEIEPKVEGRVRIAWADTDEQPELARRYRIASVPTVLFMVDGIETERSVGVEPEKLRAWAAPFTERGESGLRE